MDPPLCRRQRSARQARRLGRGNEASWCAQNPNELSRLSSGQVDYRQRPGSELMLLDSAADD
jgi:hypothetical protein